MVERVNSSRGNCTLGRLALLLVSTMVALAMGEAALRLLWSPPKMIRLQQLSDAFAGREEARFIDIIFENDPDLFWRLAPNVRLPDDEWPLFGVISNRQRPREDHEIPSEKDEHEVRILFLGDSTVFGYLLAHSDPYVEQSEIELRRRVPGLEIECINAGVPGYSLFQGWRLLVTEGARYQPDLVVLSFG
jgi:hypothetical protein